MKSNELLVKDIAEAIRRITAYLNGVGKERFFADIMIQDAVIRNLEIIGEATKKISEEYREQHADIPWREMAGLRDVLIHNYGSVDLYIVWKTVVSDIPQLGEAMAVLLEQGEV